MVDKNWINTKIDDIVRVAKSSKDSEIRLIATLLVVIKNISKTPNHLYLFGSVVRKFLKDMVKHRLN